MRTWDVNETKSLDVLISALCRDYERRQKIIEASGATKRTLIEFRYLNFKIMDAVLEIVEEKEAELYIYEIGNNVGYAKSEAQGISEIAYKKLKRTIKDNIARRLHLSD